ncbi:hypothetical protein ACS0TY_002789 [Phlomoides rotata]
MDVLLDSYITHYKCYGLPHSRYFKGFEDVVYTIQLIIEFLKICSSSICIFCIGITYIFIDMYHQ